MDRTDSPLHLELDAREQDDRVMALLAAHVPLSLLLDLLCLPAGRSEALLDEPADLGWLRAG